MMPTAYLDDGHTLNSANTASMLKNILDTASAGS